MGGPARQPLYRLVFFLPYVLPGVAIGIVWGWIYDPVQRMAQPGARAVGLEELSGAGSATRPALYAVLATAIWAGTGFVFVIFLSALRNVDTELVDARASTAPTRQRLATSSCRRSCPCS